MCFRRRIRLFNARYYPDLSSKCEKNKYNLHLGWKKAQPMPSAAKSTPYAKRGKKLSQYQTWEKVRPVPNVESQAREKVHWTQSEGKYIPIAKYVWKCTPRWAREKCVNDKYDVLLKMRFSQCVYLVFLTDKYLEHPSSNNVMWTYFRILVYLDFAVVFFILWTKMFTKRFLQDIRDSRTYRLPRRYFC